MRHTHAFATLIIVALLAAPALADGTHENIRDWEPVALIDCDGIDLALVPSDAIQANIKLAAPDATDSRASVGMLWCTRSGLMPNLVASYELTEFAGWDLYADLFGAVDLSGGGAGISADAPDQFPVFDAIKDALNADRAGIGIYYTLDTHSVDVMFYTTF